MIVPASLFMWICTVMIAGLGCVWMVYDTVLLLRALPKGRAAHDQIFGSIIGLIISAIALIGVLRFQLGG